VIVIEFIKLAEMRSRRESNPHLRFRKPLFYPLNYGNNDVERINGLNGDEQDTVAVRGDFSRGQLRARLSAAGQCFSAEFNKSNIR
jgi:hypothetical protein